ncbi:DUF2397 family protein [Micromonospora humida]|uniref:DUF2397 family protein n=1 Tax=Micromonospora humida TaxID=2809018 RepID=UPI00344350A4
MHRLLDSVDRTVRDLIEHLSSDAGLLPTDLNDVRTRLDEMQRVTADFYAALAQMVQSDVTDDLLFGENRDRAIGALRQFPREYGRALRRVEAALTDLESAGHRPLVETAAMHAGLLDTCDQQESIDERVRRLSDLAAWFAPSGSVQPLISSAAGAVHTLLVAIDRRYTALRRGSDLAADFRELAYSLSAQPDDDAASRVYAATFGQWPAVHAVVGTTEEDVAHATPAAGGTSRHQVDVLLLRARTRRSRQRPSPQGPGRRCCPCCRFGEGRSHCGEPATVQRVAGHRRRSAAELFHRSGLPNELSPALMERVYFAGLEVQPNRRLSAASAVRVAGDQVGQQYRLR